MIKIHADIFSPIVLETKDKEEYEKIYKFLKSKQIKFTSYTPETDKRRKYYRIVFDSKYNKFQVTDYIRECNGLEKIYNQYQYDNW